MNAIIAYRCFVCGKLYDRKSQGFTIAKAPSIGWQAKHGYVKLHFCQECAERMMWWARTNRDKRLKEESES